MCFTVYLEHNPSETRAKRRPADSRRLLSLPPLLSLFKNRFFGTRFLLKKTVPPILAAAQLGVQFGLVSLVATLAAAQCVPLLPMWSWPPSCYLGGCTTCVPLLPMWSWTHSANLGGCTTAFQSAPERSRASQSIPRVSPERPSAPPERPRASPERPRASQSVPERERPRAPQITEGRAAKILFAEGRAGELSRFFPGRSNSRISICRRKNQHKSIKNIGSVKMNSKSCLEFSSYLGHSGPVSGYGFHFGGSRDIFLRSRTSFLRKQGRFFKTFKILYEEAGAIWNSNLNVLGANILESLPRQTRCSVVSKCNFKEAVANLSSLGIHF